MGLNSIFGKVLLLCTVNRSSLNLRVISYWEKNDSIKRWLVWAIPVFIKISVEIPLLMGWSFRSAVQLIKGNGSEWHVILLKKLTILVGRAVWYHLSKVSFATFACCSDGFNLIEALHQRLLFIQLCSRPSVKQRATLIWAQIINKNIYSLLWFLTLQKMLTSLWLIHKENGQMLSWYDFSGKQQLNDKYVLARLCRGCHSIAEY